MTNRYMPPRRTPGHGYLQEVEPLVDPIDPPSPELVDVAASWPERFRSKVKFGNACWEWQGALTRYGYGVFRSDEGKAVSAHRHAYLLTRPDADIDGLVLDHLCRNPACLRPDHLEPVTHKENIRRGKNANLSGKCRAGLHDWVPENIVLWKARPKQPDGVRQCHPCLVARRQRWRDANRERLRAADQEWRAKNRDRLNKAQRERRRKEQGHA